MVDKEQVRQRLARAHYNVEPGISEIFTVENPGCEDSPDEPIKLLEVNQDTIAVGIQPLGFSPVPEHGFPYPTVIIEVTPDEWEQIRIGELTLPHGWVLGARMPRPANENEVANR